MTTVVNNTNFESEVTSSTVPVLVDFFATWCGPCRMMADVVDELATEANGKYSVFKVDVDKSEEIAMKYGIRSVPTFVAFVDGKEIARVSGVTPKAKLLEMLTK